MNNEFCTSVLEIKVWKAFAIAGGIIMLCFILLMFDTQYYEVRILSIIEKRWVFHSLCAGGIHAYYNSLATI